MKYHGWLAALALTSILISNTVDAKATKEDTEAYPYMAE